MNPFPVRFANKKNEGVGGCFPGSRGAASGVSGVPENVWM